MIQAFHKFSQSRVAKIFLAILALSFMAFFGGGSWFQSRDPHAVVAEVGGSSIGRYEFAEKVQQQAQLAMRETSMSREELLNSGLPQMVLSQLVQETLLNLEAAHLGLTVSDEAIRNQIHSIKAFQDEQGLFDHSLFLHLLQANGLSEKAFVASMRQDLIREQLVNAITIGAYVPDEISERLFNAQYQHRQANLIILSPKDMTVSSPSNATLETFYKEHQKEFKTPELRTLTALVIDPTILARDIPVTEEDIKAAYEAKSETKKSLNEVRASIIADIQKQRALEKAYQATQELDDKIAGGATFEEIAPLTKGASLVKLELVDAQGRDRLEAFSTHLPQDKEFAQEILQTGFGLEENRDSPFTQARNGTYYTVRADTITPATFQPFAEIKERVLKVWTELEQFKAAKAKAEEYVKTLNESGGKKIAMTRLPALSLSEPSPSVSDEVKNLVFSLRPQQAGMAFTEKGFAVVLLNTITPPDEKTKSQKIAAFKEVLLKHYQSDLLMAYLSALQNIRYPVKVNKEAMKALYKAEK